MKKLLLIGSTLLILGLLIIGLTTPLFARGPDDSGVTSDNEEAWEAMHEACESGDWEAMAEAAEEAHGDDFDHMPYHDEDDYANQGGHMGRGMMSW